MKIRTATHRKLLAAILATSACITTQAADVFFNMDADPAANGFLLCGSHKDSGLYWVSTGGNPSTGGYLSVADGNLFPPPGATCCSENLVAVFPDIDGGYPIKAFHLTADVRAGNSGNSDGRPADGFSISYAREGDPVLVNATNLFAFGAAGGDDAATTTNLNGSGDLENGTKTGVAICFDAWQGNWLPDTGPGGTPGPDVEGIEIRVDDKTLRQVNMQADRNGGCYYPTNSTCGAAVCADPNTEQTGPWANDGGDPTLDGTRVGLCWARLEVELTTNKQVTVIWKGTTLVDHFQLTNYPNHKGRLVLMGRTGGNAQNAHFDNVHLVTTPAIEATFDRIAFGPNPNQFAFYISDNPPSVVTNISQAILDGADVTSSVVLTKNGAQNTGTYTQGPLFVVGSKHTASVTWKTSLGQTLSATGLQFTVPAYLAVPSSLAVSSVDTTKPGFFIRPFQTAAGNPNRNYWTDEQLEGLHGPNLIDFSSVSNATGNGEAAYNGVIDFDNGQSAGQFPNNYSWNMFGIPAPGQANENNSSLAISAYLYFPSSGTYYFGVNSDDGFRLTFGKNSHDMLGAGRLSILSFDGGRGIDTNQNIAPVYVSAPGYYGMRLMFYNGGGGMGLEFYTTQTPATGVTNILVNDTSVPGALVAYQISTVGPPYVSLAEPPLDDNQVLLNADLAYELTDSSTSVNAGSIVLKVNGVTRSPTITHPSGTVTRIAQPHPAAYWPPGTNTVELSFSDSASAPYSYSYAFVVQSYATTTLPPGLWTAPGSGRVPGFLISAFQTANTNIFNGWQNNPRMATEALNGLYGANVADLTAFTVNGSFLNSTVINYSQDNQGAVTDNGDFRSTDTPSHPDAAFPGLPAPGGTGGTNAPMDNDAMRARVFVEFPAAGGYIMGVNSDDGFRVTYGDRTSPGKSMLRVMTPAGIAGEIVGMNTTQTDRDGNNGFGGPLPTTPLFAQAVLCDPISADTALNNAAAIAGKIAVCQRTSANFATECLNCFNAGAIAVVGGLRADNAGMLPGTRGGSAATVNIPCIQITYEDGTNLIAHGTTGANSPLVLRVSAEDCSLKLSEYSGTRGSADTLFVVNVPQAGVYPLSLVWENGGGDANCEWFTIDNAGVKQLINDSSSTVKGWTQRIFPTGARLNALVVSGNSATLSWTGEGELEYTYSLSAPWNKAANQNNPQSVLLNTPGVGQTFFRIRSY